MQDNHADEKYKMQDVFSVFKLFETLLTFSQ